MMIGHGQLSYRLAVAAITSFTVVAAASGQQDVVTAQGYDWIKIGDPGNKPYAGNIGGVGTGRGSVDYTYRISKLEVNSAQWLEFITVAAPLLEDPTFGSPAFFGYFFNPFSGNYDPEAPFPETAPVQGINWRESAMYANWLHNDKAPTLAAIMNGAYDVSMFGDNPDETFTDQLTRNPDAKFWIPSLDEWLKAAHYDPNKNGEGDGGWWQYSNTSDTVPVSGIPGEGETSTGVEQWTVNGELWDGELIPLGSYPDTQSPWGLLDLSGGAAEWTEGDLSHTLRLYSGSAAARGDSNLVLDNIGTIGGIPPSWEVLGIGLRLASSIPAPDTVLICAGFTAIHYRRRKR